MRVLPKNRWYFVLCTLYLVLFTFSSCRPRGVLSAGQMRDVLYDLHYTEAVLQIAGYNYSHDEAVAQYYHEVLRRHGVTQAQFDSSLVWYTDHPERFNKIYPKVIARMEEEVNRSEKASEIAQRIERERRNLPPVEIELISFKIETNWPFKAQKEVIKVPFLEKNEENR